MQTKPRILIPEPTSYDTDYNQRGWPQYAAAIEQAGGMAVPVPLHASQEEQARLIAGSQGVLLPGSPADVNPEKFGEPLDPRSAQPDPLREAADELLLQDAFNLQKPIFGICYGMQSMNVWRGGSLIQHLQTLIDHSPGRDVTQAHPVSVLRDSRLADLSAAAEGTTSPLVNSSHHQAVARVGDQFMTVATCPDDGTIEEPSVSFVVGVQWHPERTCDSSALSRGLFRAFVVAAGAWRLRANGEEA
jgi:putative glutamine amidotransferase